MAVKYFVGPSNPMARYVLQLIGVALAAGLAPPAYAQLGGKVAVLDVQLTNLKEDLVPILTEVLTSEVDDSGQFDAVISGRDVAAMLGFEAQKQMVGCTDAACLAEIGGALGVDRILAGHVGNLGGTFVVTIKLINIVEANTERRVYRKVKGGVETLLDMIPKLLREMLPRPDRPGEDRHGHGSVSTTTESGGGGIGAAPVVLWVVGAAAIGAGVGFGLIAQGHADNASNTGFVGGQNEVGAGQTSQIIANVGYGVGAAAVVSGFLVWLLSGDDGDKDAQAMHIAPMAGDRLIGVAGRF